MSHWFHRNPIKPTAFLKYELKGVLTIDGCSKICSELRMRRDKLFDKFKNAGNELQDVDTDFIEYLRLFAGFVVEPPAAVADPSGENGKTKDSKLIPLIRPKWGHSMLVGQATEISDAWFEVLCLVQCMAMWLMKHAAWVAGKDDIRDSEVKECLSSLRRAAGMFAYVAENSGRLTGANELEGCDFDPSVMRAYEAQCIGEAQELVVARAIEQKHNHLLISSLATHTAQIYAKADKEISGHSEEVFGRWRKYFQLKHHIYLSYAYAFLGQSLLNEDKCGQAVRACKEGIAEYDISADFASKYAEAAGPGSRIKPEKHLFFRSVLPLIKRHLEKAERENGFIYHEKVPDEVPLLESDPNYGITKVEPFMYPPHATAWSTSIYNAFDLSKSEMPDFSKMKKSKVTLEPVKEEKIYQTEKDPSNSSGCVIQ